MSDTDMSRKIVRNLIDIGANLTDPMFKGLYNSTQRHREDLDDMIARAKENGLKKIIITGGTLKDSQRALELAQTADFLFSTVGCHPTRCTEIINYDKGPSGYLDDLRLLAKNNPSKVVAIGEIGLDYERIHHCPEDIQKTYFEQQLVLAEETKLPLFLHNRRSIDDFIDILSLNKHKFQAGGGVVHSFDGSQEDMERCLELGLYIGINGCSLKTEENLEVAKLIPSDKLMIETDCPYCEIRPSHAAFKYVKTKFERTKDASDPKLPVKGRNEPMTLIQVLEVLSDIRQENIETLSEQIWKNTNNLFFKV